MNDVPGMTSVPFRELVPRLAQERDWSMARLYHEAWDPNVRGTSADLIKKAMKGQRKLKPVAMEAVARALSIDPMTFPEYRLAKARERLDESAVGLDAAVVRLERLERLEGLVLPGEDLTVRINQSGGSADEVSGVTYNGVAMGDLLDAERVVSASGRVLKARDPEVEIDDELGL